MANNNNNENDYEHLKYYIELWGNDKMLYEIGDEYNYDEFNEAFDRLIYIMNEIREKGDYLDFIKENKDEYNNLCIKLTLYDHETETYIRHFMYCPNYIENVINPPKIIKSARKTK